MIEVIVEARPRDLGGFSVRRALPAVQRRRVGPFIFFDHMGPAKFAPGVGFDVRPHPHIGLATVTYLFEGGAHLEGHREIFWNFVSSSKERIERAKADWKEKKFAKVPGDDKELIPLPE